MANLRDRDKDKDEFVLIEVNLNKETCPFTYIIRFKVINKKTNKAEMISTIAFFFIH